MRRRGLRLAREIESGTASFETRLRQQVSDWIRRGLITPHPDVDLARYREPIAHPEPAEDIPPWIWKIVRRLSTAGVQYRRTRRHPHRRRSAANP